MAYINQIEQLLYEYLGISAQITDNPNTYSRQGENVHTVLSPSNRIGDVPHLDIQHFDVWLITVLEAQAKATLESRKNTILTMRTNSLVGYQWSKRVLFSVASSSGFAEGDTVHNGGTATGVISRINETTFYLKSVTGTWDNSDTITNDGAGTTTLTAGETIEYYPLSLDVEIQKSSMNGYQLTIEGRWALQ